MSNTIGQISVDRWTTHGRCGVCGDEGPKRQTKNPKYFKANYGWVFERVSWFRGDDVFLGKICKACYKAGRINELEVNHE